ncbi:MAG: hypothetical protein XXXJIFNMEKO3_01763 [Candidatus Erwinia impunctatus]|nr:hypothetical protein XXXJIFNMEKO_01763 [Culicoides impunctatus]
MKRFISMLAILLVVIITGLSALVLLVDPNDFRHYMVQEVAQRSGYKLTFNGDLRWHVWPQLSILSGPITLNAPGATQPLVNAENMRLDVHLLPLLSHQLSVSQVMLKGAVVNLTPDSEEKRLQRAPVPPDNSRVTEKRAGWKFAIERLHIMDSLVIWQRKNGEQLNIRDVNLRYTQQTDRQAQFEVESRLSRDQKDLLVQAKGQFDTSNYPQQLSGSLDALTFQLTGADLPPSGINGQLKVDAIWQREKETLQLKNLALNVNESMLQGELSATLAGRPKITLALQSPSLDLDSFSATAPSAERTPDEPRNPPSRPVISQPVSFNPQQSFLNHLDGSVSLQAEELRFHHTEVKNVNFDADSNNGIMEVKSLTASMGKGSVSLAGELDFTKSILAVRLAPDMKAVPITPLLALLKMPPVSNGDLTVKGEFQGNGFSPGEIQRNWEGSAMFSLDDAELQGINFQQMIHRALVRGSDRIQESDDQSTFLRQDIRGKMQLDSGKLSLSAVEGNMPLLRYQGAGYVNLQNKTMDMTFNFSLKEGWRGDAELLRWLQRTSIPLRIYGEWTALNYSLQIDKLLRQYLQNDVKDRLKKWADRSEQRDEKAVIDKVLHDL